jgi:superfamily II DNA or RNA helicase
MNKSTFFRKKYSNNATKTPAKKKEEKVPPPLLEPEYKNLICTHSYLGKKGYTIPKEYLKPEDETFLRKDLFVRPAVNSVYGADTAGEAYPVFRENDKKMYLPRFYGISRYGLPCKTEIEAGEDINLSFPKPLRDYQDKIIQVYTNHVNSTLCKNTDIPGGGGILEVPCGKGKCLGKNTPILMYNGEIKMVQDIVLGDCIMGDDSTPRKILSIARGREPMYKIMENNGPGYIVNESHILSLKYSNNFKNAKQSEVIDIPLMDFLNLPKYHHERGGPLHGYRVPIEFPEKETEVEPYQFGMDIYDKPISYIPQSYKCNSRKKRLELLAGIIDSNGVSLANHYEIINCNETVANDIAFVCRSLGIPLVFRVKNKPPYKYYSLKIYPNEVIPVKTIEKLTSRKKLTYKIKIQKLEEDDYYGFEIDGNRRFVLGDFTVTHNTVMSLKIISLLHKKTLILVHKEFLMNQWIERIDEFLPGAKIGKIQGNVCEVHGRDIVIGMIQSIYNKEYPGNVFSSFGLTIIDEVHRIGSEEFSKTLLKINTPYMLGISATVDRKDKLTKVLYMFIGPKIYTEKREDDVVVNVRAIQYNTNDREFNEVEYDFRGTVKYSTMITKLCGFGPRSDFIVKVIGHLVDESPENQIMILCSNKSLLRYLHDAIVHRKIASTGYYIGGMKQEDLQATEKKQIVLATYAMAAEALDIKTLSTLIMVTPKTDIVQSVGRILRMKHENPIIVDIVDAHDVFKRQWKHRKQFYEKCNYRIQYIDSCKYVNMEQSPWKLVYEPNAQNVAKSSPDEEDAPDVSGGKCLIDCITLEE